MIVIKFFFEWNAATEFKILIKACWIIQKNDDN